MGLSINSRIQAATGAYGGLKPFTLSQILTALTASIQDIVAAKVATDRAPSNIAVTGPAMTLTAAQAQKPVLRFTGTLTANTVITLPAGAGSWQIINATTGSFTFSVKTPSQTAVTVTQGSNQFVFFTA